MSTLSIPFLSSRGSPRRSSFPGLLRILAMTLGAIFLFISAKTAHASGLVKAPNNLGLVGYWSFEDGVGLKATDFSGNGNTGTLINGPVWTTAGKIGKALNFTAASGQYVAIPDSNSLDVTTAFTISVWTNGTSYVAKNDTDTTGAYIFYAQVGTVPILTIRGIEAITDTGSNCGTAGQWAHFTVVHVGTNYAFYCNGTLNSNVTSSNNPSSLSTGLMVGYYGEFSAYANGATDEVRIYNRALGATEVAALYNSGGAKMNASMNTRGPQNGLVGQWSFDGQDISGTTAYDRSGQGNNGTLTNGPQLAIGKQGSALSFDGVDDYVDIGSVADNIASGDATVSAWVRFPAGYTTGSACASVFRHGDGPSDNDLVLLFGNWTLFSAGLGKLGFAAYDGAFRVASSSQSSWEAGRWYHVVGTVVSGNGGPVKLYVDGSLVDTASMTGARGSTPATHAYLRNNFGSALPCQLNNEDLDDVRIYSRALSAAEVLQLYNLGTATVNKSRASISDGLILWHTFDGPRVNATTSTDSSGQGNNGTLTGSPQLVIGKQGSALSFDGSNDYTSISDNATLKFGTSSMSVSAWIKPPNSNQNGYVVTKFQAVTFTGYTLSITGADSFGSSGKKIGFLLYNGNTGDYRGAYTNNDVVDGNWHHIVGVNTGAALAIYVDGVSVAITNDRTNGSWPNTDNNVGVGIGATNSGGGLVPYTGLIDDVRIYNRALSASEVLQLYNAGK